MGTTALMQLFKEALAVAVLIAAEGVPAAHPVAKVAYCLRAMLPGMQAAGAGKGFLTLNWDGEVSRLCPAGGLRTKEALRNRREPVRGHQDGHGTGGEAEGEEFICPGEERAEGTLVRPYFDQEDGDVLLKSLPTYELVCVMHDLVAKHNSK